MATDLTVAAIPGYFGTMGAEYAWLRRRAETGGPSAADYTRDDTFASLAMGVASLLGRIVTGWLLDRFFAGRVAFALLIAAALGTFVLSWAHSLAAGALAAMLIGFGMGGEADVTPYLLSRYFGLRSFSTLYGFTWTAYALAGAIGPMIMGRAFDMTGSYESLLAVLALLVLGVATLMLWLPAYESPRAASPAAAAAPSEVSPSA